MKKITVKPTFVQTKNVRNFQVMMDGLDLGAGEGRLGLVFGRAGRGKTRTAQWYMAQKGCVYLRAATVWRTSELDFLRSLARELGARESAIPHRKGACFRQIVDRLMGVPRPIFIDELEKLPGAFLDIVRDITDMTAAPIILVGEEELRACMRNNRRVWSRTWQQLEFLPITAADIITYGREATGLAFSPAVAQVFLKSSGGDFRIVRRDTANLVQIANAKGTLDIDDEMASQACQVGLTGRR